MLKRALPDLGLLLCLLQACSSELAVERDEGVELQSFRKHGLDSQDCPSNSQEEVALLQSTIDLHQTKLTDRKDARRDSTKALAVDPRAPHRKQDQQSSMSKGDRQLLPSTAAAAADAAAADGHSLEAFDVLQQAVANTRQNSTAQLQEALQHSSIKSRADPGITEPDAVGEDMDAEPNYAKLFRPVSATTRDTAIIAMVCLAIYSTLALTVNFIELSEHPEDITPMAVRAARELEAKLTEGSALVKFLPLFASQFVAFRMYVLVDTHGYGEPPFWAKRTMDVTVGIQICRVLCLLLLPSKLLLKLAASEGQDRHIEPDAVVVDKLIKPFERSGYRPSSIWFAKRVQVLFSVMSVASWFALWIGIMIYASAHGNPPPPVIATTFLCGWCIIAFELLLWFSAPLQPTREKALLAERWHRSLRYGTRALRKAPMFCVLMMADGERAMQINAGFQQGWAYTAMFTACGAMATETLVCMYIGYHLLEVSDIVKDLFRIRLFRHFSAAVCFTCTAITAGSIFVIPNTAHIQFHLSTTVYITIMLSAIYYAMHAVQGLWAFIMDIREHNETVVLETLLQTTMSINICPMLGILFVACRMRALQISANLGDPQLWAQDCMRLAAFGVGTQVVLALALPIFTGASPSVAADGSPRFEKEPLTLAYVVSIAKWVSLVAIHGSAIAVAVSIYLITPKIALAHIDSDTDILVQAGKIFTTFVLVAVAACVLVSAKMIGLVVKLAIERIDKSLLGISIEIKQVLISLWQQRVTINGLVAKNPDNHEWRSDFLASLKLCIVEVSIWRFVRHGVLEINLLALQHVEVNFEKPLDHYSNVQYVLGILKKGKKKKPEPASPPANKPKEEKAASASQPANELKEESAISICLHQIALSDVKAKLLSTGLGNVFSIVAADWKQQDYAKETGKENLALGDIAKLVLETLLNTILHNVGCQAMLREASKICSKSEPKPEWKPKGKLPLGMPQPEHTPDPSCCSSLRKKPEEKPKGFLSEITHGY